MPEQPRQQNPDPSRVTEEDLFTPASMVQVIVKGAQKRFRTLGEQLESLNKSLDAFDRQLAQTPAHLRNQDPGAQFVEKAMGLLQAEIEKRDPQRSLLPNQEQTREVELTCMKCGKPWPLHPRPYWCEEQTREALP